MNANEREVAQTTQGISRNMQLDIDAFGASVSPLMAGPGQGGGDLNGTAATVFFGKSGTNGQQHQLIRSPRSANPNYCGIV